MAKTNGSAKPEKEHNQLPDVSAAIEAVKKCEQIDADLETLKAEYMNECKALREDKKDILEIANQAGADKTAIKAVLKTRKLQKKIHDVEDGLQLDGGQLYESYMEAVGDWGSTPLGQASEPAEEQPTA